MAVFSRAAVKVALVFFISVTFWWVSLYFRFGQNSYEEHYLFAATYGLICLWGAFFGFNQARRWGGLSSVIGRALAALSLGLLAQEFGQLVFSFYNIFLGVEIPYPSLADLGFFGSIPFYVVGVILLGRSSGVRFSLSRFAGQMQAVLIPLFLLLASYFLFLRNYEFDWSSPLKVFLDFGYPLGQGLYLSLTLLFYSLSRHLLGGLMRNKMLLLFLAFLMQYLADYNFLFQSSRGTWLNGGYGDYLYFLSYFMMTLGLISFYDRRLERLAPSRVLSPTTDIYSRIVLKIIAEQREVIGPLALSEASKVENLKVSPDLKAVQILNGGGETLAKLVGQYEKLFGKASVAVCKKAAGELLTELDLNQVPEILR